MASALLMVSLRWDHCFFPLSATRLVLHSVAIFTNGKQLFKEKFWAQLNNNNFMNKQQRKEFFVHGFLVKQIVNFITE